MPGSDEVVYVRLGEVRARYGVSHMWVEQRLRTDPTFPRPAMVVGKRRFWRIEDLVKWERSVAKQSAA